MDVFVHLGNDAPDHLAESRNPCLTSELGAKTIAAIPPDKWNAAPHVFQFFNQANETEMP
jgi:hypothetical protein